MHFADSLSGADVLSDSSTRLAKLGTYRETADGRGFRYMKVGAVATVPGKVYQSAALDATNQTVSGGFAVAAAAVGDTTVTTTATTTLAADLVAEGFLSVDVTPGAGQLYQIKTHLAAAAAVVSFQLYDPIRVALTTSSRVIVTKHPYDAIVVEPGTPTGVITGVASHVVTAAQYGWIQTFGVASVLFTGTGVAGKAVGSLSGGTSGSSAPCIAATNILGYNIATTITGEYGFIFLTIK